MKKWMIVLVGTLLLMVGVFTVTATAADVVASGECGDKGNNVMWTLDSAGLLVISGTGDMMDYDGGYLYPSYYDYSENIKSVRVENGVTSVGKYAFLGKGALVDLNSPNYNSLISVNIGNSVISIKAGAFNRCSNLKNVIISDSVTEIHQYAFENCTSLDNIIIPDSVNYIGNLAFEGCHSLHKIVIPDSVLSLGNAVFAGCWT